MAPPEDAAGTASEEDEAARAEDEGDPVDSIVQKLEEELRDAQTRLREISKAYHDLQKEMKAYRERMDRQSEEKAERQAFKAVSEMLGPVENLRRSLDSTQGDPDALRAGLEMVFKQFKDALVRLGLEEVPGEGSTFDPTVHEALCTQPVADPDQDGKVLQVHCTGYTVKGKVVQSAKVVVGKHEPATETPEA